MSLFYVNFVSFLEKGGKALLLGSVFPVRCQTSFQKYHDLTGLDRAWWFCHHVNSIYIFSPKLLYLLFKDFPQLTILSADIQSWTNVKQKY